MNQLCVIKSQLMQRNVAQWFVIRLCLPSLSCLVVVLVLLSASAWGTPSGQSAAADSSDARPSSRGAPLYTYTLSHDGTPESYDEAMAVASLQGIINRDAPTLYVLSRKNTPMNSRAPRRPPASSPMPSRRAAIMRRASTSSASYGPVRRKSLKWSMFSAASKLPWTSRCSTRTPSSRCSRTFRSGRLKPIARNDIASAHTVFDPMHQNKLTEIDFSPNGHVAHSRILAYRPLVSLPKKTNPRSI